MTSHPFAAPAGTLVFAEDHCANCLEPLQPANPRLFCSDWCREVADAVRYERAVTRDGRIEREDVRDAVTIRRAHLLNGGYARLGRTLTTQARQAVIDRDGGACQECGRPGTDVDHIDGSSPDMSNLQLLCADCHREKSMGSLVEADDEDRVLLMVFVFVRVAPETPTLLADSDQWQNVERGLRTARRRRVKDALAAEAAETARAVADAYYPTAQDFGALAQRINRGYDPVRRRDADRQ